MHLTLTKNKDINQYNTRNKSNVKLPLVKTNCSTNSFDEFLEQFKKLIVNS